MNEYLDIPKAIIMKNKTQICYDFS